jgi:hypothetical protein
MHPRWGALGRNTPAMPRSMSLTWAYMSGMEGVGPGDERGTRHPIMKEHPESTYCRVTLGVLPLAV